MDTNAQNTLVLIFQHVDIFFTMLDQYSDTKKSVIGFQISAYESVISTYVNKNNLNKQDIQRLRVALSIKNLDECSLLLFVDESRGQFALHKGLLQTIQNLDSKRIRELGQPDLDNIYLQIKSVHDYFMPKAGLYDKESDDFKENLSALMDILQDTLTKIDHNVRALEGSSKRLSEILESHDFNQMVMSDQVSSALKEVIRISKRNIGPTLTFLNEKAMTSDSSAMLLIRNIRERFQSDGFHRESSDIATIEMKLLSYAEVIMATRRRMNQYVEMGRSHRELYNRIEHKFNKLYELVVQRLDSKLTGKKIPADAPFFDEARSFRGLASWTSTNLVVGLIEMPERDCNDHLDEYLREQFDEAEAIKSKKRTPRKTGLSAKERLAKSIRIEQIKKVMDNFIQDGRRDDLYLDLHGHLVANMPTYELKDIFDAMHFVSRKGSIHPTTQRAVITHNSQTLTYLIREQVSAND
jgi:hypothetical protein